MPIAWLIILVLLVLMIGSGPWYSYSANWGYIPSGALFVIVIVLLVLAAAGRI